MTDMEKVAYNSINVLTSLWGAKIQYQEGRNKTALFAVFAALGGVYSVYDELRG